MFTGTDRQACSPPPKGGFQHKAIENTQPTLLLSAKCLRPEGKRSVCQDRLDLLSLRGKHCVWTFHSPFSRVRFYIFTNQKTFVLLPLECQERQQHLIAFDVQPGE